MERCAKKSAIEGTKAHETKHVKNVQRWHDVNEGTLGTECDYRSKEDCEAERKDREKNMRKAWANFAKQERAHKPSEDWK